MVPSTTLKIFLSLLCLGLLAQSLRAFQTDDSDAILRKNVQSTINTYNQTIASGKSSIPTVKEFCDLFPTADNFITYYTGERGNPVWNSKIGLYSKYIVTLQVDITLDTSKTHIISSGMPRFTLVEVMSIAPASGYVTYNMQAGRTFGLSEWKKLVASKGDFSSIDIHLKTDAPVLYFSDAWKHL